MTIAVQLNTTSWVLVSSAAAGFMENQTGNVALIRVEDTPPANTDSMGHQLKNEDGLGWSRATAKNIYARLLVGQGSMIVTEG
ncbi:hypothetical protein HRJ35_15000 [Shewanella oneidensis MR-1]|uniref:Mu phage uncharacterized protein n=1 Tax=Shewanella oneidensis (strain ATCC 700550 / JCM 31522 / CIP 106686 / LMG 19005 / NCIMB 14063 / MR-1) TaxID=211586 RepID=Q8EDQ7_SHEON|nr:phage protein [Shewanella oneidensis]AAN55714.1 Mu phage uncharacterized protein [Shewanella oneidensis MR-1]MDX5995644.1 hypothetical protein [Shewanella oneidensis]MEE2026305.1 hypothetical protein [Shewanella oneidensis]QKG97189.1 hypothetical protein HRJ35_15000 [Shewanella oneidensis MR-1]